jgi:hypothetical protein
MILATTNSRAGPSASRLDDIRLWETGAMCMLFLVIAVAQYIVR